MINRWNVLSGYADVAESLGMHASLSALRGQLNIIVGDIEVVVVCHTIDEPLFVDIVDEQLAVDDPMVHLLFINLYGL